MARLVDDLSNKIDAVGVGGKSKTVGVRENEVRHSTKYLFCRKWISSKGENQSVAKKQESETKLCIFQWIEAFKRAYLLKRQRCCAADPSSLPWSRQTLPLRVRLAPSMASTVLQQLAASHTRTRDNAPARYTSACSYSEAGEVLAPQTLAHYLEVARRYRFVSD